MTITSKQTTKNYMMNLSILMCASVYLISIEITTVEPFILVITVLLP